MKYNEIWEAVDKLAEINGLTPSGLAKKAGLDPTTFNKSKRFRPDGKKRWPSLDSINKITSVCHMSFEEFYHILDKTGDVDKISGQCLIPLYSISKIGVEHNSSKEASYINFPDIDGDMYAILLDDLSLTNVYPLDCILIVSEQTPIKKGNKIVLKLKITNEIIIGEFICRTNGGIKIINLANKEKLSISANEICTVCRIMWVSQ